MINSDLTKISGDKPVNDSDKITTNKTTDVLSTMTNGGNNLMNRLGLGYSLYEDELKENILPIKEYNKNDVLDKEETIELPDIYSIQNSNLSSRLKSLISLVNAEDKESDKVAIFADFIRKVNINNVSSKYKKGLIKLLKEKL